MLWSTKVHHVADLMRELDLDVEQMADATGLEERVVEAIANERFTPTAEQRELISEALGVHWPDLCWGHRALVEHLQCW